MIWQLVFFIGVPLVVALLVELALRGSELKHKL
jgi:hypothetical protein